MPLTISLSAALTISKYLAVYLGFVEDTSRGVQKLIHAPLQSAYICLEEASRINNDASRFQFLIQEAERYFHTAVPLEESEAKVDALLGLSLCQFFLGDKANAKSNAKKMTEVKLSDSEIRKLETQELAARTMPFNNLWRVPQLIKNPSIVCYDSLVDGRNAILDEYKDKAVRLLVNVINDYKRLDA